MVLSPLISGRIVFCPNFRPSTPPHRFHPPIFDPSRAPRECIERGETGCPEHGRPHHPPHPSILGGRRNGGKPMGDCVKAHRIAYCWWWREIQRHRKDPWWNCSHGCTLFIHFQQLQAVPTSAPEGTWSASGAQRGTRCNAYYWMTGHWTTEPRSGNRWMQKISENWKTVLDFLFWSDRAVDQ